MIALLPSVSFALVSILMTYFLLAFAFGWHGRGKARWILLLLLVFPFALFVWSANSSGFHYKSGSLKCSVQQIDLEGVWSRTWEGVLIAGPARELWHVSVINDAPANALRQALDQGHDVLVHYDVFLLRGWLRGASEAVVTRVEAIR